VTAALACQRAHQLQTQIGAATYAAVAIIQALCRQVEDSGSGNVANLVGDGIEIFQVQLARPASTPPFAE
jgi:hypothetical protein